MFAKGFYKTAGLESLIVSHAVDTVTAPLAMTAAAKHSAKKDAEAAGKLIAGNQKVKKDAVVQYFLNPFVGGPITELENRMERRYKASRAEHPFRTAAIPLYGMIRGGKAGEKEMQETD